MATSSAIMASASATPGAPSSSSSSSHHNAHYYNNHPPIHHNHNKQGSTKSRSGNSNSSSGGQGSLRGKGNNSSTGNSNIGGGGGGGSVGKGSLRGNSNNSTGSGGGGGSGSVRSKSKRGGARPQRLRSRYPSKFVLWLEPRLLKIATGVTLFGVFLQLIAISTNSWMVLEVPGAGSRNVSGKFLLESHTGLWKVCRVELIKSWSDKGRMMEKSEEVCEAHDLFPSSEERESREDYDRQHLDYTRTAVAFTIIALVITVIGHCFAIYSLKRPRYIIKRLAALLHFMTAACLLVLNEVFIKTVEHERENMPELIPKDAVTSYGYSFVLSWLVFCFFVLAGLVYLFSSHKRKAEYADSNDALEDEPMEIFRR